MKAPRVGFLKLIDVTPLSSQPGRLCPLLLWPEQVEVAAAHEMQAVAHEADRLGTEAGVSKGGSFGHALAEQRLGDGAVIRAGERGVQRPKRQLQPPSSVGRQARRRRTAAHKQPVQPTGSLDPFHE